MAEVISIEFAHSEPNITLSESKFDPSLFESLGKLLKLLKVTGVVALRDSALAGDPAAPAVFVR